LLEACSVEKNSECHFERAEGESRNLFLSRFLHFATLLVASVEMTVRLFNKALEALTDQIRCSSRSIGANIAESWQKRRYPAHFVSKLSDADGEQAETQHWLETSFKCKYISNEEKRSLLENCKKIGRMLGKMMAEPESFCSRFQDK